MTATGSPVSTQHLPPSMVSLSPHILDSPTMPPHPLSAGRRGHLLQPRLSAILGGAERSPTEEPQIWDFRVALT